MVWGFGALLLLLVQGGIGNSVSGRGASQPLDDRPGQLSTPIKRLECGGPYLNYTDQTCRSLRVENTGCYNSRKRYKSCSGLCVGTKAQTSDAEHCQEACSDFYTLHCSFVEERPATLPGPQSVVPPSSRAPVATTTPEPTAQEPKGEDDDDLSGKSKGKSEVEKTDDWKTVVIVIVVVLCILVGGIVTFIIYKYCQKRTRNISRVVTPDQFILLSAGEQGNVGLDSQADPTTTNVSSRSDSGVFMDSIPQIAANPDTAPGVPQIVPTPPSVTTQAEQPSIIGASVSQADLRRVTNPTECSDTNNGTGRWVEPPRKRSATF